MKLDIFQETSLKDSMHDEKMNRRIFQPRRLVYTKKLIMFSRKESEVVMDVIPMSEVSGIVDVERGSKNLHANHEENVAGEGAGNEHDLKVVLIQTIQEGYNSGRSYQIQIFEPRLRPDG